MILVTRLIVVVALGRQMVILDYFVELLDSFVVLLDMLELSGDVGLIGAILCWCLLLVVDLDMLQVFLMKLPHFRLFRLLLLGYLLLQLFLQGLGL